MVVQSFSFAVIPNDKGRAIAKGTQRSEAHSTCSGRLLLLFSVRNERACWCFPLVINTDAIADVVRGHGIEQRFVRQLKWDQRAASFAVKWLEEQITVASADSLNGDEHDGLCQPRRRRRKNALQFGCLGYLFLDAIVWWLWKWEWVSFSLSLCLPLSFFVCWSLIKFSTVSSVGFQSDEKDSCAKEKRKLRKPLLTKLGQAWMLAVMPDGHP